MISKLIGLLVLLTCLTLTYLFETAGHLEGAFRVFHWPALSLTLLGPIGLVLFSVEFHLLILSLKRLSVSLRSRKAVNEDCLDRLTALTPKYYAFGTKSLSDLSGVSNPMVIRLVDRLSMKIPLCDIRNMMEIERDKELSAFNQSISLIGLGVKYCPSVGMLGTILGMVQLLSSISDPSMIGSHMSLALLTTFYGLFFSLALWSPLQHRLQTFKDIEMSFHDSLIHWVELMEKRKPAHYFEEVSGDATRALV